MMVTRTINYGWNQITRPYYTTCPDCGKQTRRIASRGFNKLATSGDRARYSDELRDEADRLSQIPVTCNKCLKQRLAVPAKVVLIEDALVTEIASIEAEDARLEQRKQAVVKIIGAHRNRLFEHMGATYVQSGCGFGFGYEDGFTVSGYRISKVRPWEATDDQVHARLEDISYLDDTLEARKEAIKGVA